MENLKISTDEKTIIWEGWDISKTDESGELTLSKGVEGGIKVGFKTYMRDETAYETIRPQDELSLEYKILDEDGAFQFKTKEKEDFFGIIKKYKF